MTTDNVTSGETVKPITEFYLTGLRLNGRSDLPDFYTFLIEQDGKTLPLLSDGQVVLFTHIELAERALRSAGISAQFRSLSRENVYLVDVALSLYLIAMDSADPHRAIANMLDLFAKILTGLGIGVPPIFADTLIDLGTYIDSNPFFGDFMAKEKFLREKSIDAVRWCLGTIFSVARIITVDQPEHSSDAEAV